MKFNFFALPNKRKFGTMCIGASSSYYFLLSVKSTANFDSKATFLGIISSICFNLKEDSPETLISIIAWPSIRTYSLGNYINHIFLTALCS